MAWISVHDHILGGKLRGLARQIGCSPKEALGILVSLWLWGLYNADKTGELKNATKEDVADCVSTGMSRNLDPMQVIESLIVSGWMDEPEDGKLFIHDWDIWQEQWYKFQSQKEYDAKRKREARARLKNENLPVDDDNTDAKLVEQSEISDIPPDSPAECPPDNNDIEVENKYSKAFEEFWTVYPRKIEKGNAYKKFNARIKDGFSPTELKLAAQSYAAICKKEKTEQKFIKYGKAFLSETTPFIDYLPKKMVEDTETEEIEGNPFEKYKRGEDDE